MEFQHHSVLTPSQIENARFVFKAFADTIVGNGSTPTHMGVLAVLQYLGTIGIHKTENEVKDFILAITQPSTSTATTAATSSSADIASSTTPSNQPLSPTTGGLSRRASSPSQASQTSKGLGKRRTSKTPTPQVQMSPVQPPLDPTANTSLLLSFENFLTLTLYTFDESTGGDCDRNKELRSTFNEFDGDRDGSLSYADLKALIQKYFVDPYLVGRTNINANGLLSTISPHCEINSLTYAQLQAILTEMDVDGDKFVSFEDFKASIETS